MQVDALLSEPPGKPKNTGVGNLSLLQGIFLIQESNLGLLHCRRILYQLKILCLYKGSPYVCVCVPMYMCVCVDVDMCLYVCLCGYVCLYTYLLRVCAFVCICVCAEKSNHSIA